MRSSLRQPRGLVAFIFITGAALLLLFHPRTDEQTALAASPQGKGGAIKPLPTPTPVPKKTQPKKSQPVSTRTGAAKPSGGTDDAAANERVFWESIRNSTDPEDFREYLRKYPNGQFAGLARNRLKTLEAAQPKPTATPDASKETTPTNTSGASGKPDNANSPSNAKPDNTGGPPVPAPKPGTVVRNQIGMELVYVPAGTFTMGSDTAGYKQPVHQVMIRESFYMGRYEVTQAQWREVMGNNPSSFKGDDLPVENVLWNDAKEFIRKLNARDGGFTYRLPTEAEWEYTCRAGTTGDNASDLDAMAWYEKNSDGRTHPVGGKQPNAFGLYDMQGNVNEWCEDVFHESYNDAPTDGSAWLNGGDQGQHVLRGGPWAWDAYNQRCDGRGKGQSDYRGRYTGFRVVAVARTR